MIHEQKAQASAQKSKAAEKSKERHSHRTDGSRCPICGAEISSRFEICPECGGKLVSYCTFCGADMDRNDTECPECGMPAGGVKCPECGTLNHRSFCSKCNTPLTRAAQKAVQKALEDPKVKEAIDLCAKLAELEAQMEEAEITVQPATFDIAVYVGVLLIVHKGCLIYVAILITKRNIHVIIWCLIIINIFVICSVRAAMMHTKQTFHNENWAVHINHNNPIQKLEHKLQSNGFKLKF